MTLEQNGKRRILIAALLCLTFFFLFTRLQVGKPGEDCVTDVVIGHAAHFTHICDTYGLTESMDNLGHFLTAPSPWRVHTVYILSGTTLAAALSPVAQIFRRAVLDGRVAGSADTKVILKRFPDYFGLQILNFLILAAALWMTLRLVGAEDGALAIALAATVATSDLVHGMFWVQHPMFMNLIVPLGSVFYFMWGCRARQTGYGIVAGFGLAAAACILIYSFTMIWLPAFVLGALYRDWRMGTTLAETVSGLWRVLLVFAIAGCAPVLAWLAINVLYLHVNVSYEAETLRMFTWLSDAWREHQFGAVVARHWHGYLLRVWGWLGWQAPVSLAVAAMMLWLGRRNSPPGSVARDPIIVAVAMTIVIMLVFNFLQGLYEPRMTNGIVLLLFVALARIAQRTGFANWGTMTLAAISVGQVIYAFLEPAISGTL
jgi:hypothetical protein